MATHVATSWHLEGTLVIACNCDYGCPCNFNAPPTQGHCEGQWLWHVEHGRFGETRLDGLSWTITADWPGAIHEGGGRAISFYDERADDAQREAIEELVRGGSGGPWAIFINTYELEAVKPVPVDLRLAGLDTTAKLGPSMELAIEPIRNPVTGDAVHPGAVLPEGLVCKEMSLASSRTFRVSDAISYDHSGHYAAIAPFDYSSP